jgi:hypothetical protein
MGYNRAQLAAERLQRCCELAPPRAQAYLEAEVEFVLKRCTPASRVLELRPVILSLRHNGVVELVGRRRSARYRVKRGS